MSMTTPSRFPEDVVHSNPERLGGTPVFVGTRVPVQSLLDYLEAGDSLDEFLRQFPSVRREQAIQVLDCARARTNPENIPPTPGQRAELDRRLDEMDQGHVETIPWDEVKRRLRHGTSE
jgi:uncharacterized protein (DUF433 family)